MIPNELPRDFRRSAFKLGRGAPEIAPICMEKKSRKFFPSERWLEDELSYLQQKLAGIPAILELPTDRPRPPVQTFRAVRESIVFPKASKRR